MRAVRVTGPATVDAVEVPAPVVGDGVRVRITACGICGSDLHLVGWGVPVTLGHEIAGRLDDGTPVVLEPQVPCGTCDRCAAGMTNHCRTLLERMYGVSLDGGLADEIVVAARTVIPVPVAMPPRVAALAEPLAVGIHGLNRAGVEAGQRVLVVGGGSIGLLALAAAVARGAAVDLAARHPHQAAAGEALGGTNRSGEDYDVVIDAAGTQSSVDAAMAAARPGGVVLSLGTYWDPVQLDTGFGMREVSLIPASTYGHHHGRREFLDAVDLLAARPAIADAVVTHEVPLAEATRAFAIAGDRAAGALKVILVP
jgi:2-desacetyl-2-hydroxyethyl bacteriochlorophyllide A dehydrogenase